MTTANPFAKSGTAKGKKAESASAAPKISGDKASDQFSTPPAAGADPFDMPSGPGSGERITDLLGELLLVKPLEYLQGIQTKLGETDAIRADVAILSGDRQGDLSSGMLVFQIALMRDLMRVLDGPNPYLLGRLGLGQEKSGKSAPYIFEPPTDEDKVLARQYLSAQ